MSAIFVVVVLLASWRVARLLTVDEVFRPARELALSKVKLDGQIAYLLTCPWCMSVYTSAVMAVTAVYWGDNRVVAAGFLALAGSLIAGMGQTIEDRLDR